MRQPGEPTVEELLDSIKRVMARDDRGEPLASTSGVDVVPQARSSDPLVAAAISANLRGSLETLAATGGQMPPPPAPPATSGLEDMVRELLRPALSDWLDRNLPAIVERMVAAEVERIGGQRG